MDKIVFGEYFKKMRKQNNLSLKNVSDYIFVSVQAINKYEKGINYPDTMILGDIAKLFNVDFDSFISLESSHKNDYCDKYKFDINKFAKQFNYLRKSNNLSLTQLAERLGVQYQTISKWEKGESLPNIEQLKACAEFFNITPSQLYFCIEKINDEPKQKKDINKINHIQTTIIAILSTIIITSSIFLLTENINPSSTTKENTIRRPFDVDAKIEINFFNINDPAEIQEQSMIYYKEQYTPSTAIEYSYNNEQFDVFASESGTITEIKLDPLYGRMLYIQGISGYTFIYGSLDSAQINIGTKVTSGDKIAIAGSNTIHASLGNHLHFAIMKDSKLIDPETFFEENIKNN